MTNTVVHIFLFFVVGTLEAYLAFGSGGGCVDRWTKSLCTSTKPEIHCSEAIVCSAGDINWTHSQQFAGDPRLHFSDRRIHHWMNTIECRTLFSDMPFILVSFPLQIKEGLLVHVCVRKDASQCSSLLFLLLWNNSSLFGKVYGLGKVLLDKGTGCSYTQRILFWPGFLLI